MIGNFLGSNMWPPIWLLEAFLQHSSAMTLTHMSFQHFLSFPKVNIMLTVDPKKRQQSHINIIRLTSNGLPRAKGKGPFKSLSSVPQRSPILWLRTTTCFPPSLKRGLIWKAMSLPLRKFTVNLWKTFLPLLHQWPHCVECTIEKKSEHNWELCCVLGKKGKTYILALGLTRPRMVIIILS